MTASDATTSLVTQDIFAKVSAPGLVQGRPGPAAKSAVYKSRPVSVARLTIRPFGSSDGSRRQENCDGLRRQWVGAPPPSWPETNPGSLSPTWAYLATLALRKYYHLRLIFETRNKSGMSALTPIHSKTADFLLAGYVANVRRYRGLSPAVTPLARAPTRPAAVPDLYCVGLVQGACVQSDLGPPRGNLERVGACIATRAIEAGRCREEK